MDSGAVSLNFSRTLAAVGLTLRELRLTICASHNMQAATHNDVRAPLPVELEKVH